MADPTLVPEEPPADLVAYLDGELEPRATHEMEKRLKADPKLRAHADAIRQTWALLDYLPQPEPSPTFTTRTLDKLAVLRPAPSQSQPAAALATPPSAPTIPRPQSNPWPKRLAWIAAAAALFIVGLVASGSLGRKPPTDPKIAEEQMAQDLRVLDNLNLYQYGDDLAFVFGLDQADLFGDDAAGR